VLGLPPRGIISRAGFFKSRGHVRLAFDDWPSMYNAMSELRLVRGKRRCGDRVIEAPGVGDLCLCFRGGCVGRTKSLAVEQ
jgi:hypothetical protein